MTETKKKQNDGYDSRSVFWIQGEGMTRRSHNIDCIKRLIERGLSYQEIVRIAGRFFTFKKVNEYYEIARSEIDNKDDVVESAIDYMKRRNAEKENKK